MTNESELTFDVNLPARDKPARDKPARDEPARDKPVFMQAIFNYASLSTLLRILGAGVLVTSVTMFLFKGWSDGNDLQRYWMFLAHTLMLAITGVVVGRWVKESKGARLFLGLSLVSTVVNFAVLGGLIYSQMQWDSGLASYPSFATWKADSLSDAIVATAIAWCLLAPVAWFSFMALARRSAGKLTALFMLSSTVVLLPIRQTEMVVLLVASLSVILIGRLIKAKHADSSLETFEGRFARLVTFAGPVILIGRGTYLYTADMLMMTLIAALCFVALRQFALDSKLGSRLRRVINSVSVIPAVALAYGVAGTVVDTNWISEVTWLPMFGLVLGALLVDVSMRDAKLSMVYRRLASAVVVIAMLANLALYASLGTAIICVISGALVMIYGYSAQQRIDFVAGLFTMLTGIGHQCVLAFEVFDLSNWSALAIFGVLAIVAGSVLERHGAIIRARVGSWQRSFQKWQY